MVTLAGTIAAGLLLDNFTTIPELAAKPVRVTVPTEEVRPVTVDGFKVKLWRVAGVTVRMPD